MIEFTQEQWQAINHQAIPTVIEPMSRTAYVVVRKEEYDKLQAVTASEPDAAYVLRIAWIRRMGLDEDEISESIRDDPPRCVKEEMKQLKALENLDETAPSAEQLRKHAIKY